MSIKDNWQAVIGLEIHVETKTKAKMFCHCLASHFQAKPNTNVCPVCLGLPGAMPYPNIKALEKALTIAKILNCRINTVSRFERKHYFYPDLPKSYQLTQYLYPIGYQGKLRVDGNDYYITRVHQEEDTAKLKHEVVEGKKVSLVDFNRSGVPLVEIVTEPTFTTSEQVVKFLKQLQKILRFNQVSDCDMEKGSMRLEANVSVKNKNQTQLPDYKVELKNINSFRFLKEAIDYEIERQVKLLAFGKLISQETRGYNSKLKRTFSQRHKEAAHDYRYLLEPDIPHLFLSPEVIKAGSRFKDYDQVKKEWQAKGWPADVVEVLLTRADQIKWWQELDKAVPTRVAKAKLGHFLVKNKSRYYLKDIGKLIADYAKEQETVTDTKMIRQTIKQVIKDNPKAVVDWQAGKQQVIYFLLGQVRYKLGNLDVKSVIKEIKQQIDKN